MSQSSNFVDYVKICCRSGHGGAGSSHLHRDILTSKGGPDGGDGGRGGHIIVKGSSQLWTLLHLKYRKHIIAENGFPGSSGQKSGRTGIDEILEVPLGTIARNAETGEQTSIETPKRVRPWWFTEKSGKLCFSVRYGARVLDIAKGKNAIEVTNLDDLVTVIETVKSAVEAGELDAQIELANGSLKAGFKK